jgi:hypothetical protein
VFDEAHDRVLELFHEADYPLEAAGVAKRCRSAKNFGRQASALGAEGLEEVDRLDFPIAGVPFSQGDHFPNARRDQDAFPQPFLAGPETATNLGMDLANVDAGGIESPQDTAVALLEQRYE